MDVYSIITLNIVILCLLAILITVFFTVWFVIDSSKFLRHGGKRDTFFWKRKKK